MTDCDVVPLALPACAQLSNGGEYTTHEGFVPALVSASAAEYLRVTRAFAELPLCDCRRRASCGGHPSTAGATGNIRCVWLL